MRVDGGEAHAVISVPGYEIVDELGRGGFATVFRATQLAVGRDVAIKVLSDPDPPADMVRRFTRESRAVGALSWHPHIATIFDAGTTPDGRAYIAFELLTGGSLEDAIALRPMSWADAVAATIQVTDAVEAAHRADVLHRDIKPANILRDRFGQAKLADFGIASMQDGTKTATGSIAVTVAHAAPEIFDGAGATPLVDVYALGSTLHNLITGSAPFAPLPGEGLIASIGRIATQPVPALDPAPGLVADIVARALAKDPADRWASAADLGRALQRAQIELGLSSTSMPIVDDDRPDHAGAETRPIDLTTASPAPRVPPQDSSEPEWFAAPPATTADAAATEDSDYAEPEWF